MEFRKKKVFDLCNSLNIALTPVFTAVAIQKKPIEKLDNWTGKSFEAKPSVDAMVDIHSVQQIIEEQ